MGNMPPDEPTPGTTTATTEAPPTADEQTPSPEATDDQDAPSEEERAAEAGQPETRDLLSQLDDAPVEDLLKHRRVQGIVGQKAKELLDRQLPTLRTQLADEIREQIREEDRQERLRLLREEDPLAYLDETDKLEAEKTAREQAAQREAQLVSSAYGDAQAVVSRIQSRLPKEVQAKLSGKSYDGAWAQGFESYLDDVITEAVNHGQSESRKALERELRPVIRKEVLRELNAGDPAPDGGAGSAKPGALTQQEWDEHRSDSDWRRENRARINSGIEAGTIRY